jgi:predicted RNase H-like HicB family nuclease
MKYYAAVFLESHLGDWRVLFPDLPDCEASGYTLEDAAYAAATALARCASRNGATLAAPRNLAEIAADTDWLARHDVEITRAVVSMVPLQLSD